MLKDPKSEARSILVKLPAAEDARLRAIAAEMTITPTALARILLLEAIAARDKAEALKLEGVSI